MSVLVSMLESVESTCPYCGEPVELSIDEDGGFRQAYVEDCPVCCQPWEVEALLEGDGRWSVTLRRSDE
jgi:hypothetical protein